MFDDLSIFLTDLATPEQKSLVEQACLQFDRMNDDSYVLPIQQYLAMENQADSNETLQAILDFTRVRTLQLLEVQGIVFSPDAYLANLVDYLRITLDLTEHESFDELQRVCESDGSAEELYAELLELKSDLKVETILNDLQSVNQKVLPTILIEAQAKHQQPMNEDLEVLKTARILEYKAFISFAGIQRLRLAYLLKNGLDVNYPFKLYLNMLSGELDQLDPQDVAKEFCAAAYLSNDAFQNPRAAIQQQLEKYITDPDKITKTDIFVSDLIIKFSASAKI